jgi:uncharacterized protein (DUF1810 family)
MEEGGLFDLDRFLKAQEDAFERAFDELCAGEKQSHWMWFIFPQLRGLGHSRLAQLYGICSLAEARTYLQHPVLGLRLRRCTEVVMAVSGRTLQQVFGSPDDLKFRSSMTLFALASENEPMFREALDKYCNGTMDPATKGLLKKMKPT